MPIKKHHETLKTPLYSNCKVEDPNGIHIFNASRKKVAWYLKRELAKVISAEPFVIRLSFTPKKQGHAGDAFYLATKNNVCVVCGLESELTRHHIVPYMYRQHFPIHIKDHSHFDILLVCIECHKKYEIEADKLKREICEELFILQPTKIQPVIDKNIRKISSYAHAIIQHSNNIPNHRKKMMLEVISCFLGKENLTIDDIEKATQLTYKVVKEVKNEGLLVVEKIKDIQTFVVRWRQHFLAHTNPQYMPEHWNINRSIILI